MKKILFASIAFIFLFSCNRNSKSFSDSDRSLDQMTPMQKTSSQSDRLPATDFTSADSSGTSGDILQGSLPGQNPDWDKKIIRTADMRIEVKNFATYNNAIHNEVKRYGGYVATEEQNFTGDQKESTMSVKVPVDQFEDLVNQIASDSDKVLEKKISSEDITGEIVDTKSRLETKEQMRLKYLEFLKQSKNMDDVLKVQSEINNIQEQIESATGQINYLSHQSAYSTINLIFYQPLSGYKPHDENPGFASRLVRAFENGFHFIAEIFIALVSVWPLWLLIFVAFIFYKKHNWKPVSPKQNQ